MRLSMLRATALAAGLVVGALLAEAALRLCGVGPSSGPEYVNSEEFARVPGIFAPGQRVYDRTISSLRFRVSIDSLGFRGRDYPRARPAGELRVLLVGDSFTYGDFVDDDQTLPAQVERSLRASCGSVTVINAGLGGATITEEGPLAQRALAVSPGLVLLVFFENDVADLLRSPSRWAQMANHRRAKSRFPLSVLYPLLRRTALWNLGLRAATRAREVRLAPLLPPPTHAGADTVQMRLRAAYLRELVTLRDTLAARHVPFFLALFPGHSSLRAPRAELLAWMTAAAQGEGVRVFNLQTPLAASGAADTELYLLPQDAHPAPRAYQIAGTFLAGELAKEAAVQPHCGKAASP